MAIALRGTTSQNISTTVTLPVTTNAGDFIVISLGSGNANWTAVTVSGAGATWSTYGVNAGGAAQGNWFAIGYNCSAGTSSVTLSSNPSTTNGGIAVSVFSGVATTSPIASSFGPLSTATLGTTVTQTGLSWSSGQLLLSVGEAFNWFNLTSPVATWGSTTDPSANSKINGTTRQAYISWQIASSSLSSQTFTSPQSSTLYGIGAVYGFIIKPAASSGNMLLAMSL